MKRLNDVRPPLPLNLRSALKVNLILSPTTPLVRNPALFQNFPPFSFFPLKNNFIKPACNKPFVIFEGVIRCSCHFNLGD